MAKKPSEFHGVEADKAEAMRRYNNRKSFRNILRQAAVALLVYLWFPKLEISIQTAGDWFQRTGALIVTNRFVVFVFSNLLIALVFLLSSNDESSSSSSDAEADLYDQYTSSSAEIVKASAEKVEDDSRKQIVPAFIAEVEEVVVEINQEAVTTDVKGIFRRTQSETKTDIYRPVTKYRRTESAKVKPIETLSSEEFRLTVERFIMEKKRSLVQEETDVVLCEGLGLVDAASSGYGSC